MFSFRAPSFLILAVTILGSLGNLVVSGVMSFILTPEIFKDYFLIVSSAQILANIVHFGGSNFYAYLIAQRVEKNQVASFVLMHSYITIPSLGIVASVFLFISYSEISYGSLVLLLTSFALQGLIRTKMLLNERYGEAIKLGILNVCSVVLSIVLYHLSSCDLGFLFALQGGLGLAINYYYLGMKISQTSIIYIPGSFNHMFYSMLNSFFVSMCMTGDRLLVDSLKPLDGIIYSYSSMVFGYMLIIANYSAGLWTNLLTLAYRNAGNLGNDIMKRYEIKSFLLASIPVVLAYPGMVLINLMYDVELGLFDAFGFAFIIGLNILMKYYLALLNIIGLPKVFSISCCITIILLFVVFYFFNELKSITELLVIIVGAISLVVVSLSYYTNRQINVVQGV